MTDDTQARTGLKEFIRIPHELIRTIINEWGDTSDTENPVFDAAIAELERELDRNERRVQPPAQGEAQRALEDSALRLPGLARDAEKKEFALAMAILWACDSDGGVTDDTRKYYDWAVAVKERIPGNPQVKDVIDAALSQPEQKGTS